MRRKWEDNRDPDGRNHKFPPLHNKRPASVGRRQGHVPANTFDIVGSQQRKTQRKELPNLAGTQPSDRSAYCHGQVLDSCSEWQAPRSQPPLSPTHSLASVQGTITKPCDARVGQMQAFCLLLLYICKLDCFITSNTWHATRISLSFLRLKKDFLCLIKRKWYLAKTGK